MADEIELYAGFASPIGVHFAALNDLDSVPTGAGWYAWFQIPGSLSSESFQLYRHATVGSSVTGIFNLTFEGRLKAADGDSPPTFPSGDDETLDTLKSLFLAFAPPLYIGISKNLRTRLKTHRKHLQEFMRAADGVVAGADARNGIADDTEKESQYFGSRVGTALRSLKLSPDTLYVKCVLAEDPTQLKKIEKALNFALTPHYGRK